MVAAMIPAMPVTGVAVFARRRDARAWLERRGIRRPGVVRGARSLLARVRPRSRFPPRAGAIWSRLRR